MSGPRGKGGPAFGGGGFLGPTAVFSPSDVTQDSSGVYTVKSSGTAVFLVDTPDKLAACLAELGKHSVLALDLEGVNLGARDGEVALLQLSTGRHSPVFLVDVCRLGAAAFGEPGIDGSLRSLLEAPTRVKLCWDLRSDSSALFRAFGIRLGGVVDLQLDDVAGRLLSAPPGRAVDKVSGLGFVLERTGMARLQPHEQARVRCVKEAAVQLFSPELGGGYGVWLERPLRPLLLEYCTDSRYFFTLHESYAHSRAKALGPHASVRCAGALAGAVARRVDFSISEAFDKSDRDLMISVDVLLVSDVLNAMRNPHALNDSGAGSSSSASTSSSSTAGAGV